MSTNKINTLSQWINEASNITVLTGAGMSTESGIPDFRSTAGYWTNELSREELMSYTYLTRYPDKFWPAYKGIFQLKLQGNYRPNAGHYFLSSLEKKGKNVNVLTQNVDGLHFLAGSSKVIEIHGSIRHAFCPKCKKDYDIDYINDHDLPQCNHKALGHDTCDTILHPGVVLFGDAIHHFEESMRVSFDTDLFIVLGSSLQVGPVNELPIIAHSNPTSKKVIINREPTHLDHYFDLVIHQEIGSTLMRVEI